MPEKNDLEIEKALLKALNLGACICCNRSDQEMARSKHFIVCNFKSDCKRQKKWEKFTASPEWVKAVKEYGYEIRLRNSEIWDSVIQRPGLTGRASHRRPHAREEG